MPPGQEKFVVIGDLEGWGYANSDIHGYLAGLSILQVLSSTTHHFSIADYNGICLAWLKFLECRNITQKGLQRYSLCMLPTFLWQCGRLFILL
jgi:hypothetical protein